MATRSVTARDRIIAAIESHTCPLSTDGGGIERRHYVTAGACGSCDLSIHGLARLHGIEYLGADELCRCHN